MKPQILIALLRKEITLMKRNPIIPKIIFMMPLMVMLVIPLVANLDVKNVSVTIVDNDHSQLSRRIIADISASEVLNVVVLCNTHNEAMLTVENGNADVLLTIPANYSRDISSGSQIDVEANGVNATKGMIGSQYVVRAVMESIAQWQKENGMTIQVSNISVINRYNPTLNFRNYMIPALMVVLLIIICGFLPALNLVSEKETGTIDAMNVTPVSRLTFVMSGFGVAVANYSSTMLQSIFVMFAFIMIFQLMSGLFTPIGSMPQWAQTITFFIPPRYFIEIMRSIYLKGTPLAELFPQFIALLGFATFFCSIAALSYKKQVLKR